MPTRAKYTGLRSRRTPRLKVVGSDVFPRHQAVVKAFSLDYVVEILTFEEWDRTPPALRPHPNMVIVPGIGFIHVRHPHSDEEKEDIRDIGWQAMDMWKEDHEAV